MLRKLILFLIDIGLTLFSGIVSLFMRFGFDFEEMGKYDESVIIYTLISSIVYILNGNYRIVWEYASPRDMLFLVRGSIISYLVNVTFFYFYRGSILPRSVGFSTFLGSLILLLLSRITWQWISNLRKGKAGEKRILIIGAGDAGIMLLEEFEKRPHLGKVVAFMDDSKRKIGRRIRGVPVFGPITETMKIVEKERIDEVIIAIPSATKEEMERILKAIDLRKIRVRTLPGIYELTDGRVRIGHLRDISIEDLLGREQVKVNLEEIGSYLKGRRVLVTGAGGSIGSELCRQIARMEPDLLILLGHGENSVYLIDEELSERFEGLKKVRVIADIGDWEIVEFAFKKYRPEIVFHAAAHKHVPLMEENPFEAIRVNTLGTRNLVKLSMKYNVKRFVLVSTDKAVNPTSIMGVSKRLAEIYVTTRKSNTIFSVVRFGNVLGSRGSVIPKFKKQIEKGGPVTVTHPDMKRFFMTIPEAVSLILQAGAYAKGGDLFVLDMGEQISIDKLARDMITLAGFVPDQDIKVVYTGIRPGEKLFEELYYPDEERVSTSHPKVFRIVSENDLDPDEVEEYMKSLEEHLRKAEVSGILEIIRRLVPQARINFTKGEEKV